MKNLLKKILFLFNKSEKKKLFLILLCVIIMGFIEMVGIATILPFLAVVTKPEVVQTNKHLSALYQFFGFTEAKMFILFLGSLVFTVLVFGNAFSALTTFINTRFCFSHGKKLSYTLLENYLSQPYTYFLHKHSGTISKNVLTEVDRLVAGIFINGLQTVSKIVLIACIFGLLVAVDPYLAVSTIAILGTAYVGIYAAIRRKLMQAGQIACDENNFRYQLVTETLSLVKELKVLGREKTFLEQYGASTEKYVRSESLHLLSPGITRYVIEAIAFGGMVLIALYLISTGEELGKFMPLLGLYALAGYRLMPAMQQLFTSFSSMRFHLSALDNVFYEIQLPSGDHRYFSTHTRLSFHQSLVLRNIHFNYPSSNKAVLTNLSLELPCHSTIGIVGASGAGKTTLVDIILGLIYPTQGKIEVDAVDITTDNVRSWQHNIGYVPQTITLMDASIRENIALGIPGSQIDDSAVQSAAKMANLHDFVMNDLPEGYATLVGERGVRLSGGQRQRIGIARALYHDPELLIFDEATSALDSVTEKVIMESIHQLGRRKTIILIAHRLNTVKACDIIYVLNKGEIIGKGPYQELLHSNAAFQSLANAIPDVQPQ